MSSDAKLSTSYQKAIESIKAKGFSHIKVELEAELYRGGNRDAECYDCDGTGIISCSDCAGVGEIEAEEQNGDSTLYVECSDCGGEGSADCYDCGGRGSDYSTGDDEESCQSFLEERMGSLARKALVYGNFYDDGSVDSEYTFTMKIEDAHLAINVINAFKALAEKVGNGFETSGAGMHISVLPSGSYPCNDTLLNKDYMANFREQVKKLLPALYFIAAGGEATRGLSYRSPRVSRDDKYSAIFTHGDSCIEYRLFDTCYQNPERIFDHIETIANTLRYYSLEKVNVKYQTLNFQDGGILRDWYSQLPEYDALTETLKIVKPSKPLVTLRKERGMTGLTKSKLMAKYRQVSKQLEAQWRDYESTIDPRRLDSAKDLHRCILGQLEWTRGAARNERTDIATAWATYTRPRMLTTALSYPQALEMFADFDKALAWIREDERRYKELCSQFGISYYIHKTLDEYVQDHAPTSNYRGYRLELAQ